MHNFAFFVLSDHAILPSLNDSAARRFYADSPRILIASAGPTIKNGTAALRIEYDLRRDAIRGVARDASAEEGVVERKIWFGALEGALEHELGGRYTAAGRLKSGGLVSTSALLQAEGALALRPEDAGRTRSLFADPETAALASRDLKSGATLVAPRGVLRGGHRGWWAIAGPRADTRAILENGAGSFYDDFTGRSERQASTRGDTRWDTGGHRTSKYGSQRQEQKKGTWEYVAMIAARRRCGRDRGLSDRAVLQRGLCACYGQPGPGCPSHRRHRRSTTLNTMTHKNFVGVIVAIIALIAGALAPASHAQNSERWVGTWATALVGRPQIPPPPTGLPRLLRSCAMRVPRRRRRRLHRRNRRPARRSDLSRLSHFTNQTLRQIVRASVGGSRVRVVLSNAFGTAPLTIGAAHIALRDKDDAIQATGGRALAFSGRPSVTIPANAIVYSDPVALAVTPLADLAIDLYLPGTTNTPAPLTMHNAAFQTNYISETGNHAGAPKLPTVCDRSQLVSAVARRGRCDRSAGAIVAFGDSITDGAASTPDTNSRWPDVLARRLLSSPAPVKMGILNAGIGGNRVLSEGAYGSGINALARFEIDALSHPGVTHIIVMEGINDIGNARQNPTPTAEDLIAGHKQLIDACPRERREDSRCDAHSVLGRRLLHGSWRSEASGAERVDSNQQGLRRRRRLRQGDARSERSEEAAGRLRLVRPPASERRRVQSDGGGDRPEPVQDGQVRKSEERKTKEKDRLRT